MTTEANPTVLYLDLLKKTLTFSLWQIPGTPVEAVHVPKSFIKRRVLKALVYVSCHTNLQIAIKQKRSAVDVQEGRIGQPAYAHTMIGLKRLDNLQFCVENILKDDIPGDMIETGVWRGGACIFLRAMLATYGITDRRVFVADSFVGLPEPDTEHYPQDEGDRHYTRTHLRISKEEVENNFRKYGLLDEQVVFLKGWFKDTLPDAPIEKLSLLRLDGDMYQSTMEALNALYPKLSNGGYCIIDDYGAIEQCKRAVDDYRAVQGITNTLETVDWTGVFWRKG